MNDPVGRYSPLGAVLDTCAGAVLVDCRLIKTQPSYTLNAAYENSTGRVMYMLNT